VDFRRRVRRVRRRRRRVIGSAEDVGARDFDDSDFVTVRRSCRNRVGA
jgi:hypothetical protein